MANSNARKLTFEDAERIRFARQHGVSPKALSFQNGVTVFAIYDILKRRSYRGDKAIDEWAMMYGIERQQWETDQQLNVRIVAHQQKQVEEPPPLEW